MTPPKRRRPIFAVAALLMPVAVVVTWMVWAASEPDPPRPEMGSEFAGMSAGGMVAGILGLLAVAGGIDLVGLVLSIVAVLRREHPRDLALVVLALYAAPITFGLLFLAGRLVAF
jgi:hypothetical protein